ncbi:hypothetical protein K458DRAFT_346923 [Lentithecium fluviatile CBS 122367]|uniref:Rhodopsin domain-containing protein n=1 Tax=Lentithecium fluviatile CBS 122367 TaxID=1168545 RepID=A0A6G1IM08_9PLEO|nr:hypothetical protein K458DRAFT_346923 [Lentithecium fluviatile CBS 122367]
MAGENFLAEAWSELAIALCTIGLRLYFRITQVGIRKLGVDDYLMICAGALYVCETTAAHYVGVWLGLANNNITPEGRASLDPNSQEWRFRVNGSKTHIVGWFMYTALFWLLKCCWTVYYSRMTDGVRKMDIRIKMAWVFIGSTYVAAVCMILFKCWPLHRQWQINPDPGNNCQPGFSKLQVSFVMAINTATDLYLMAIPIPIIWKARLDTKRKISLMVLFSGGWIVIIFGILRCVTLVTVGANEPSESGQWSVRESFVAVLVSNAPMVFPLFKRWFYAATNLTSSGFRSNTPGQSYPLDSNIKRTGGGNSHARSGSNPLSGRHKKNYQHPLSIPNDTAWGSDEHIVHTGEGEGKKDGAWDKKVGDKSSNESLSTVREEVGMTVPKRTAAMPKKGSGNGLNDIVMTREWEVSETYEQDGGRGRHVSHFGSAPPGR